MYYINYIYEYKYEYYRHCNCSKEWAVQFYCDVETAKIHIGVSSEHMHTARDEMNKYWKENSFGEYEIEEYERSRFVSTASIDLRIGQLLKSNVDSDRPKCFLFSGTVIDAKTGITVAHGFEHVEEKVYATSGSASELAQELIGKCREKIKTIHLQSHNITADLAIIDLEPTFNVQKNVIPWPGREIRVKMYRGDGIPDNKRVMILNQDGEYCYGAIRMHLFSDRLAAEQYYNVLAISSEDDMKEVAITRDGDSGALVMSTPEVHTDVVLVYGIVIAMYDNKDKDTSLTIANSLPEVVGNIDSLRQQSCNQHLGCATADVIDFTNSTA